LKSLPNRIAALDVDPETAETAQYDTRAGVVVGAHGIQGTVKVKPVTRTSYRLFTPSKQGKGHHVLLCAGDEPGRVVEVTSSKRQEPKDIFLVRIRGIDDRTSAERLLGHDILGKSADREPLTEDEFFVEDLIGLKIVDRTGQEIGTLAAVHSGVANDVYETDQGVLIPAVKAFVERIDLSQRTITVVDATALVME
jgi:16S rRNA processing protein RimM